MLLDGKLFSVSKGCIRVGVALSFVDLATTIVGVGFLGFLEANPIMAVLLEANLWYFILVKGIVSVGIACLMYRMLLTIRRSREFAVTRSGKMATVMAIGGACLFVVITLYASVNNSYLLVYYFTR